MKLRAVALAGLSAAMLLSACAANETKPSDSAKATDEASSSESAGAGDDKGSEKLSGEIQATGASSMEKAQNLWVANYAGEQPDVTVGYTATGSGKGRENFISGASHFAGSDRAWKPEENTAGAFGNCTKESISYDLPIYISPIAVVYNLEGVDGLNLTPELAAKIFKGKITKWNDEAIKAENKDLELPDQKISIVHRSDESGTTENFTDWLNKAAGDVWTDKADGKWKGAGGDAADGTSGIISAVKGTKGAIGYADLSQSGDVQKAKINGVEPNSKDAAMAVEKSPIEDGRKENDLAIALDRKAEGYPIVLISYALVCADYEDDEIAKLVKGYIGYVASEEGQKAAEDEVGVAPLSSGLSEKVKAAIDAIQ
ncbi:phosphate ABC transporter substrate-binding protein PstS [uncultured Tessaracoccus sp.]|uniref:phosphate ABC transporter substrate-binding protein PstS n=1 Tax=uncultured Tessaracoccus sp. TaxID=905023 RepID=UPI0025FF206D|nr:phosphate ABC transporter substrate-binding protein PstS [uncultured Tessaracoccus sp.]